MERIGVKGICIIYLSLAEYIPHLLEGEEIKPLLYKKKRLKSHKKSLLNEGYLNQLL